MCLCKVQSKEKEILLQQDVQQEQPEAILRMQEDNEALEELVSRTVMCMYMYVCICSCSCIIMHV